jgi:XTP/dITP diphosphohydrolase
VEKVIIATANRGKAKEFEQMFQAYGIDILTLLDLEEPIDIQETGTTFEENALIKAREVATRLNMPVIADDSGLEVDALDGRPGVYSARYAGEQKDDQANIEKVLRELKGVPFEQRTARFRCALAVVFPSGEELTVHGTCEGYITEQPKGTNGFGYDPIFYVPEKQCTMAELPSEIKNKISHRAHALQQFKKRMDKWFGGKGE